MHNTIPKSTIMKLLEQSQYNMQTGPSLMLISVACNNEIVTIDNSFVTPTMMQVMKALQENKIVFVTVQGSAAPVTPAALREFASDPHFNTRMVTLTMKAADPTEAKFAAEMDIDIRTAATQLS